MSPEDMDFDTFVMQIAENERLSDHEALVVVREKQKSLKQLKREARYIESSGLSSEFAIENRALRIMRAAINGTDVRALSRTEKRTITAVQDFYELKPEDQWRSLKDLAPALSSLEAQVRSLDPGVRFTDLDSTTSTAENLKRIRNAVNAFEPVRANLEKLVGPRSGSEDALLRSHYALEKANEYLSSLIGLPS